MRSLLITLWTALAAASLSFGQPAGQLPSTLKIFVLQGRDAVNDVQGRASNTSTPIVEVRDMNDQPVEGAEVIFELPSNGPGGSFPGNKITFSARTNVQGQASAPFMPNAIPGRFTIQVTATSGDRFGRASFQQINGSLAAPGSTEREARGWSKKKWLIIAAVVAAGAITAGVVLANHGSSTTASAPTPPTIAVTPGPPVFGGH